VVGPWALRGCGKYECPCRPASARKPHPSRSSVFVRVIVIGAGFSGVCMGIALKRAGCHDFVLLESGERVGGTWRDNVYPGCACDSPALLYQFSFEPKSDWSRVWVEQTEIQRYLEHCVQKYDLTPHIHFGTRVSDAAWDDHAGVWRVRTASGPQYEAEVLVAGVGQLHRPVVPDLAGLGEFAGTAFHSANWQAGIDLRGRKVVVVGNAASAVQFVPRIAPVVGALTIVQRSANWVLPRNDRAFSRAEQDRFAQFPFWQKLNRQLAWWRHELRNPVRLANPRVARRLEGLARRHLERQITDPALRRRLTPDYPIGAKRILLSDDYYPALTRENVALVTAPLARAEPDAVITADGRRLAADVLIFATGFAATEFLAPMRVSGRGGVSLDRRWQYGAEAYLGLSVAHFPNFFLLYGPNTNLGHNSIVFMIECQVRYVIACLRELQNRGGGVMSVREDAECAFATEMQSRLAGSVWRRARNWYTSSNGRITTNWPGSAVEYWWRSRRPRFSHYDIEPAAANPGAVSGSGQGAVDRRASLWRSGWAARKAGNSARAASIATRRGYGVRSTAKRRAL
jgi:cation diffusion facilitator CzcD-associated flavoprotein CzcO